MAAQLRRVNQTLGQMQKNLECSICLDLLQDPVSTKCDHQFCNFCILALLDNSHRSSAPCPLCKEPVTKRSLTSNERLDEIVRAVRGVVQAVEADTGLRCTPPRGPRMLSQQSQSSSQSKAKVKANESSQTTSAPKISKTKKGSKKSNIRQAKPKAAGSIPIYIDSDDPDDSDTSNQGTVLITDFDSNHCQRTLRSKSSRKAPDRKPLHPANEGTGIKQTRSQGVSFSSKSNGPPSLTHNKSDQKHGLTGKSSNLLQALEEGSLGVLKEDASQKERPGEDEEKKLEPLGEQDGILLLALDQESLGMCGDLNNESTSQERAKEADALFKDSLRNNNELDDPKIGGGSIASDMNSACTIINNLEREMQNKRSAGGLPNLKVTEPKSEACQSKIVNSLDQKETCNRDGQVNSARCKVPNNETSQSSADEDQDDPYEFIASQRTPRKPKPKRGRHQRNPSGQSTKEFDYMKWKKGRGVDKRLLAGSQAVFSQPAMQSQVSSTTSRTLDGSLQPAKNHSFRKPQSRAERADSRQASQSQEVTVIEPEKPTECSNNVQDDEKLETYQRASEEKRQTGNDTYEILMENSEAIRNDKQKRWANCTKRTSGVSGDLLNGVASGVCPPAEKDMINSSSETFSKPNTRGKQQKPRNSKRAQNIKEESLSDEGPPSRRLRSRAKTQGLGKNEIIQPEIEEDLKVPNKPSDVSLKGSIDNDQVEVRDKKDVSMYDDSDEESTSMSVADPSHDSPTEPTKPIPGIFSEENEHKRQSHHTELNFVSAPHHHGPPAIEMVPHEDTEAAPEVMGCSQPVVKKHSPLARAGVFGQVYKRGSLQLKKSPREGDSVKPREDIMTDVDEQAQKVNSQEEEIPFDLEKEGLVSPSKVSAKENRHTVQDRDMDLKKYGKTRSGTPIEGISQTAVSEPDLFADQDDQEEADNVVDLTVGSSSEDSTEEQNNWQSGLSDQRQHPSQCNGLKPGARQTTDPPHAEKSECDAAAIKSDWELALELAREFDTEPRQFSLRSSRRGRREVELKDEFIQPGRAKPGLDVSERKNGHKSRQNKGAVVKECTVQPEADGRVAKIGQDDTTSPPCHPESKKSDNHSITAGKKTLRQSTRSTSKDTREERALSSKSKARRHSLRRLSSVPSAYEMAGSDEEGGGRIEAYNSSVDHQTVEAHSSTKTPKPAPHSVNATGTAGDIQESISNPDSSLSKSSIKKALNPHDVVSNSDQNYGGTRRGSKNRQSGKIQPNHPPSSVASIKNTEVNIVSGKGPRKHSGENNSSGTTEFTTPIKTPDKTTGENLAVECRGSSSGGRKLHSRSGSKKRDRSPSRERITSKAKSGSPTVENACTVPEMPDLPRKAFIAPNNDNTSVVKLNEQQMSPETDTSITRKSALSPGAVKQLGTGSASLFSDGFDSQPQMAENTPRCATSGTLKQKRRRDDDCGEAESDEDDTTESIDLGVIEYEEEKKAPGHSTSVLHTHPRGSDTDSIELLEEFDDTSSMQANSIKEPDIHKDVGPGKKNQMFKYLQQTLKEGVEVTELSSPALCPPKTLDQKITTPKQSSGGKASKKAKMINQLTLTQTEEDVNVPSVNTLNIAGNLSVTDHQADSVVRLEEAEFSKSPKNTVPETVLSEISPESTPRTTLSGGNTKTKSSGRKSKSQMIVRNLTPDSTAGQVQSPQFDLSAKQKQKESPGPPTPRSLRDSSSLQESERMLVPPPEHYQKTFVGTSEVPSPPTSKNSSQGELLSLKSHRSRLTLKRKSCPEESSSGQMKLSGKRQRSAGASVYSNSSSEIKQWDMGSRRRSQRLSKVVASMDGNVNPHEPVEEAENVSVLVSSSTGDDSGGFVVNETKESVTLSIPTRHKSRCSPYLRSLSKSQNSLLGSEPKAGLRGTSSDTEESAHYTAPSWPEQNQQFSQKGQHDSEIQGEGSPVAGLRSSSLTERNHTDKRPSQKLSRDQDLNPPAALDSSLGEDSLAWTETSEKFVTPADGSSSLFSSSKTKTPQSHSSVASSGGNQKLKRSLKQENRSTSKLTPDERKLRDSQGNHCEMLPKNLTPNGKVTDQRMYLSAENSAGKRELSAPLSKPTSSSRSSISSRESFSIPYQGKPPALQELNKSGNKKDLVHTPGRPPVSNVTKPSSEEFVPASEEASVSPDRLSDPIIISRKHIHGQRKDINSIFHDKHELEPHNLQPSNQEDGIHSDTQAMGNLSKKRFSFRKKDGKSQESVTNSSSPRELSMKTRSDSRQKNTPLESPSNKESATSMVSNLQTSWRKRSQQTKNSGDVISSGSPEEVTSTLPSENSQPRKRKSLTLTPVKAKQARNIERNPEDFQYQRKENSHEDLVKGDIEHNGYLAQSELSETSRTPKEILLNEKRRALHGNESHCADSSQDLSGFKANNDISLEKYGKRGESTGKSGGTTIARDENEEEMNCPNHLHVAEEKYDKGPPAKVDLRVESDSSGDVEMVSAEDEEPRRHDNEKAKNDDSEDDGSNDGSSEDIEDEDDDVIIPPTPPCQSTTILQTRKRPIHPIPSALSASSSAGIRPSKSLTPRHSKNIHQARGTLIKDDTSSPIQGSGGEKRAHRNLTKDDSTSSLQLGTKKTKPSDAVTMPVRRTCTEKNCDLADEEADISFVKRVFPLNCSPVKHDSCGNSMNEFGDGEGDREEASENSQSLSILQGGIGEDFLKDTSGRNRNVRSASRNRKVRKYSIEDAQEHVSNTGKQATEDETDNLTRGLKTSSEVGDGKKRQQSGHATEEHPGNFGGTLRHQEGDEDDSGKEHWLADEPIKKGKDEMSLFQEQEKDHQGEDVPISAERHYDTDGSTCSESSCCHHLNLTSASSVLSSQSELMNTQQRLMARESLKKMALEIAQIEAALAEDTVTDKHPDATPDKHPENAEEHVEPMEEEEIKNLQPSKERTTGFENHSAKDNPDHCGNAIDDVCPTPNDLCTPAELFTSQDLYSNEVQGSQLEKASSLKVICDSHISTPGASNDLSSKGSNSSQLLPPLVTFKRSKPLISDDESDSDEETYGGADEVGKSNHGFEALDENSMDGSSLRSQLEIPGVTTYGSDSDLSGPEEPVISSGSPWSPSPLPAPRSPSPPPALSQSTAKRASSLANLPESVKAVSRLVEKIRSRQSAEDPSPSGVVRKSAKRHNNSGGSAKLPRRQINDSEPSDEEDYRASSQRHSQDKAVVRNVRSAPGPDKPPRQATSGWKSKSLQMQSGNYAKNKIGRQGNASHTSKSKESSTPLRKSNEPNQPKLMTGRRLYHSEKRDNQSQQGGSDSTEQSHPSKRSKGNDRPSESSHWMRKDDQPRDESPEERSRSPVIGRSVHATPAAKKRPKPMSFVTTGLSRTDMRDVEKLTKMFGCRFASTFNACTTHVIVNTDENLVCERTLKYFQGIAARVWVVSFKWVSACLKTEELLSEEPFEVAGDVVNGPSHNGPRRARLCREPYPLHKHDVCCLGPFTGLSKEQLVSLLELMGASTVQHPSLFPYNAGRKAIIVAQAEARDLDYDYDALYKKYRVPVISREWILDVIATYKIQPMADYLLSLSGSAQPIIDLDSEED